MRIHAFQCCRTLIIQTLIIQTLIIQTLIIQCSTTLPKQQTYNLLVRCFFHSLHSNNHRTTFFPVDYFVLQSLYFVINFTSHRQRLPFLQTVLQSFSGDGTSKCRTILHNRAFPLPYYCENKLSTIANCTAQIWGRFSLLKPLSIVYSTIHSV